MSRRRETLKYFGILLLLSGLVCNEWILSVLFSADGKIELMGHKIIICVFSLFLICLGIWVIIFPRKKITAAMLLLTFSICFSLILAETYLRWKRRDDTSIVRSQDKFVHLTLSKNISGRLNWGGRKARYYTNSLGFRDISRREILKKTNRDERMIFLGDSFTESPGVEYKSSFIFKLESLFRKNGRNVEILNAGVASYSPFLEYRKLKQFLDSGFKTDKAILMLDVSDVSNEGVYYLAYDDNAEFEFEEERKRAFNVTPLLFLTIEELIWKKKRESVFQQNFKEASWAKHDFRIIGLERCKKYILKMSDLCRQHSIKFYLVIYPWPSQFYFPEQQTTFVEFADANGIALYNLFPDFLVMDNYDQYYIPGDVHWNEKGHTFVASALYKRLKSDN